eukprot:scaffold28876_cov72-Phaeocystis_antarctica.AAC.6
MPAVGASGALFEAPRHACLHACPFHVGRQLPATGVLARAAPCIVPLFVALGFAAVARLGGPEPLARLLASKVRRAHRACAGLRDGKHGADEPHIRHIDRTVQAERCSRANQCAECMERNLTAAAARNRAVVTEAVAAAAARRGVQTEADNSRVLARSHLQLVHQQQFTVLVRLVFSTGIPRVQYLLLLVSTR